MSVRFGQRPPFDVRISYQSTRKGIVCDLVIGNLHSKEKVRVEYRGAAIVVEANRDGEITHRLPWYFEPGIHQIHLVGQKSGGVQKTFEVG